ncbi:MAG: hypothetical protein K2J20_00355, partial [Bacilli bacterium]|nr:hypothetical protein [Bacilli bacterium]
STYNLSLEDLYALLSDIGSRIDANHEAEVDAYYSAIQKVPQVKYLSTDFVAYWGDVDDLLPLYDLTAEQYSDIAKTLIHAGGKLNYKEAFALMTLALNRYISIDYPDNLYDIIKQFDSYISGEYKNIELDDYSDAMKAFTDCLWNFNQTPTKRLHGNLGFVGKDSNDPEFKEIFSLEGNKYGVPLLENNIRYPDMEPVQTLG